MEDKNELIVRGGREQDLEEERKEKKKAPQPDSAGKLH